MGTVTESAPPAAALDLRESAYAVPVGSIEMPEHLLEAYSEDKRAKMVPLVIIRPGLGRGRGRHLYEAAMLEENARKFSGWKMYVDHLSPEARKAAGGLPRSMRDLGGIIMESHWDATIPADEEKGHGQGGVVGWAIPTPFIRELIDTAPELVEASISANATGVRPVTIKGKRAWLVEGIEDRGSVDWVTEAGAGGRVVALMEATYSEEEQMSLLEAMSDEEFLDYVREQRPHLVEEAEETPAPEAEETPSDEAKNHEQEKDMQITPEALAEAFQSDEVKAAFAGVIKDIVKDEVASATKTAVEEAVSDEKDLIRAEARADADRQIQLRDLRDEAHRLIEAAKLPDTLAGRVRDKFTLTESGPTPALDVVDEVNDDGEVIKAARERLTEAVETAISEERAVLAEISPTRVRGQGPSKQEPNADGEKPKASEGTFYGAVLQEAGIDPDTAWDR